MVPMIVTVIDRVTQEVSVLQVPEELANKNIEDEELLEQLGWERTSDLSYMITSKPLKINIKTSSVEQHITL